MNSSAQPLLASLLQTPLADQVSAEKIIIATRSEAESEAETKTQISRASRFATELYVVSYLITFSILGTLARLGLQALTAYPGSPVMTSELWANFGGSIIMGFLSEDRKLFRGHGQDRNDEMDKSRREEADDSQETVETMVQNDNHSQEDPEKASIELRNRHNAMKKTIPLYIGLTTGFCGSLTSFSSFIRDVFLQLANQPPAIPLRSGSVSDSSRNGGYSKFVHSTSCLGCAKRSLTS